jgi:hypothetical protein
MRALIGSRMRLQEEPQSTSNLPLSVGRKSAARHRAVQVRVMGQVLS